MSDRMLANRYAEAVFWAARDAGQVEQVGEELASLDLAIRTTPAVRGLLFHPGISVNGKAAGVQEVFGDSLSAAVLSLVRLLLERERLGLLSAVVDHYRDLINRWRGVVPGEVRTVIPLTAEQRARLEVALKGLASGRVVLENRIDPEMLGGVVVRLSDWIIDGSVRYRLERLRANLTSMEGSSDAH